MNNLAKESPAQAQDRPPDCPTDGRRAPKTPGTPLKAKSAPNDAGTKTPQPITVEVLPPLPETELKRLEECEAVIRKTLQVVVFDAGAALLTIHNERLYRATHATFEAYCRDRWNICRSYAWRLVGAAERVRLLPQDSEIARPTSEFQVRPFLSIEPEAFPKAWKCVQEQAAGGKITPKIIRAVARKLTCRKRRRKLSKPQLKLTRRIPVGQVLALVHEIRRRAEHHQSDHFDAALDKLQFLLCRL
jgi:hypothetical protein